MGLVNKTNLDVANTAITTGVQKMFDKRPPGTYQLVTEDVACTGTSFDIVAVDGGGAIREWLGAKVYNDFTAFRANFRLKKWETSFELERIDIENDNSGVVGMRVNNFLAGLEKVPDKIIWDFFVTNTVTGYDGQALLSDTHTVGSSTFDNLTTAALSPAEIKTGVARMESFTDAAGEPLGMMPTHIIVGPAQRRQAMEYTGSTRIVPVKNDGTLDATGSAIAAGQFENYVGGSMTVVVNPRFGATNLYWLMCDLSKPGLKPFQLGTFRKPTAYAQLDMLDTPRFENDVFRWSIEADMTPAPMCWATCYGSVSAS